MMQVLALLFAAGFTYGVSLSAGKMLLDALGVKLFRSEEYFFGFVLGSALLSTAVFALTAAHLAYTSVFLAFGLAVIALAGWRKAYRFTDSTLPPLAIPWRIGFGLVYVIFGVVYLRNALVPENGPDAILYHIALPARYLREHFFPPNDRNMMANLSEGIEMLFLFGYAFGKHSAGAMVHLVFTLVLPFGVLSWGRRVGLPQVGAAGGLMFFVSPIVGRLATTAYIDVAVAGVVFAVFYLIEIWRKEPSNGMLVAVGLLAGFCYAAKYTAGIAVPYALAVIAYRERARFLRPVLVTGVCAAAMMAPYLVKNAIVAGNPLAPFFNRVFPNRAMTVSLERSYSHQMQHWNNVELSQTPLEVTVRGFLLQGVIGPIFLLAPLGLWALRFPAGRPVVWAAVVFTLPYFASIATRFLVPSVPFVALAMALALARWNWALAGLVLIHVVLSWPRVVPQYCDDCWRIVHEEWRDALRVQSEGSFLRSRLSEYGFSQAIEKNVPPGEPVFAFQTFEQAYQSHEVVVGWQSALGHRLALALETPVYDPLRPTWRQEIQFPETGVRKIRLLQQGSSPDNEWCVTELRLLRGDSEVARAPEWRIKAWPNPWEAPLALDNNPATCWSSGEPMKPGMWMELDFGKETLIDGVLVEFTNNQYGTEVRMESQSAAGAWTKLDGDTTIYERRNSPGLRAAATATLRLGHIRWLLINDNDLIAKDMEARQEEWGVRQVAREMEWSLYTLK